jgi:tetratricopeptide (TPR) repeat protein
MPGAFAYHLHSFSADNLRTTNQNWVGPFLAKGVTITMGCVYEPYLAGTPDMAVFVSRLIFNGFSFGEAAYASQPVLSWQTTFVGDPLYRPFGRNPEELQNDLERRRSPLLAWSYLRLLNVNRAAGKSLGDCVALLENAPLTKTNAVLSEKLGDLYASQGKPSSAVSAYENALKFDPTPMQKLRLLLTLGDKLAALDKAEESFGTYQRILHDFPNYPDTLNLYKKMLPIAEKLNKKDEAEKYRAALNPPAPGKPAEK